MLKWQLYLDDEMNVPGKMEYYLAQIAAEVRRLWVKNPKNVKLKDLLHPVKFIRKGSESKKPPPTLDQIKASWFRATGYKRKKGIK